MIVETGGKFLKILEGTLNFNEFNNTSNTGIHIVRTYEIERRKKFNAPLNGAQVVKHRNDNKLYSTEHTSVIFTSDVYFFFFQIFIAGFLSVPFIGDKMVN